MKEINRPEYLEVKFSVKEKGKKEIHGLVRGYSESVSHKLDDGTDEVKPASKNVSRIMNILIAEVGNITLGFKPIPKPKNKAKTN